MRANIFVTENVPQKIYSGGLGFTGLAPEGGEGAAATLIEYNAFCW